MLVVLLLIAMRGLVPGGFMPALSTSGGPTLVICSGVSPAPRASTLDHRHESDRSPHAGHSERTVEPPCPFGTLAAAGLPPVKPLIGAAAMLPQPVPVALLHGFGPASMAAPPPPATGPPAFPV